MIAKCGQILIWHWAHDSVDQCDPWKGGETDWHLAWKERFLSAGARVEVPRTLVANRHIADIVLSDGYVLELAGVYPPADQIAERESFYGRMAWLYNSGNFIDRVDHYWKAGPHGVELRFRFRQPVKVLTLHKRPVYWDAGDTYIERMDWIRRYGPDGERRTYGGASLVGDADEFVEAVMRSHHGPRIVRRRRRAA